MPSYNKLFTARFTQSVLGNKKSSLLCMALANSGRPKKSGYLFPCTDRVTLLVNMWRNLLHKNARITYNPVVEEDYN